MENILEKRLARRMVNYYLLLCYFPHGKINLLNFSNGNTGLQNML